MSPVTQTVPYPAVEGMDFSEATLAGDLSIAGPRRRHIANPSVLVKWILVLNLIVAILMSQIVIK